MNSIVDILNFLRSILEAPFPLRAELVKVFQNAIWNDESILDEDLNEILSELAYDLDFYEPNEEWKKESINYYGNDHLNELLKQGIEQIESYINAL